MLTINGRVRLVRRRWYSPRKGTIAPLDEWLDTLENTIRLGVREMACRLNGDGKNFGKAAASLARTAQVKLSGETLRVLVETEGKRVLKVQRSGQRPFDWSAADCKTQEKTTRIYVRSDGVAGRLIRREAGRIQMDQAGEKVGNVDGSPWIRNQIERQSLPLDASGLDVYHLSENVHKARREAFGEHDEGGKESAGKLLHVFMHDGYEAAWKPLLEWRVTRKRGRPAADRLVNYVSERREMIRFPEFQAKGWQIGIGPTEATCKTLTARLKGSGMRRDSDNAKAIMALEAVTQSEQWDLYRESQLRPTG